MDQSISVRIVVSDRVPVFRYGLKRLFDGGDGFRMVGEASSPAEAVDVVRELQPDVLLVSVEPTEAELNTLQSLVTLSKPVRCIVVADDEAHAALGPTAPFLPIGCVLPRTATGRTFLQCLDCVRQNQCWPVRHGRIEMTRLPSALPNPARRYGLTGRERQIVAAVADGGSNRDIAAQLAISEDTVKHHMSNIFDKVGVHSRLELAVFALYHHVVQTDAE